MSPKKNKIKYSSRELKDIGAYEKFRTNMSFKYSERFCRFIWRKLCPAIKIRYYS